ncbi:MAG: branched-chain amino acid aminotransferase [Desulfobacteraceae bacterium]|nr:branched-chain amino acid aminotransferase [Desulfobacteraceae bacterium]
MGIFYVDGDFVPSDKAMIPVDDLAVLRGIGVCDLMRTFRGKPFFLRAHIRRLERSAEAIGLSLKWSRDEIEAIVLETLKRNPEVDEANIRVVVTGGSSPDFLTPQGAPRLLVLITEIPPIPPEWYRDGVKVITVNQEREVPEAKSLSYIPATLALKEAKKRHAMEALYVDKNRFVNEGTTSNLFAFIKGRLVTPKENVLKGITREMILSLAEAMFEIDLRPIPLEELLQADEVFITGTNKGVVPVIQVDTTPIGDGRVGKMTGQLIKAIEGHTPAPEK